MVIFSCVCEGRARLPFLLRGGAALCAGDARDSRLCCGLAAGGGSTPQRTGARLGLSRKTHHRADTTTQHNPATQHNTTQVAEFLREHQREVVLLDLQHVRAAPTAEAHAKLLGQARDAGEDMSSLNS